MNSAAIRSKNADSESRPAVESRLKTAHSTRSASGSGGRGDDRCLSASHQRPGSISTSCCWSGRPSSSRMTRQDRLDLVVAGQGGGLAPFVPPGPGDEAAARDGGLRPVRPVDPAVAAVAPIAAVGPVRRSPARVGTQVRALVDPAPAARVATGETSAVGAIADARAVTWPGPRGPIGSGWGVADPRSGGALGPGRRSVLRRRRNEAAEHARAVHADENLAEEAFLAGRLAAGLEDLDGRVGDRRGGLRDREGAMVEAFRGGEQAAARDRVRIAGPARHVRQADVGPRTRRRCERAAGRDEFDDAADLVAGFAEPGTDEPEAGPDAAERRGDERLRPARLEEEHDPRIPGQPRLDSGERSTERGGLPAPGGTTAGPKSDSRGNRAAASRPRSQPVAR